MSADSLTLTIIVVSFNTKGLTTSCITSIYKHAPDIPFEVIVVDNASNDDSVPALRRMETKYKNFVLIENNENVGFSRSNNQGIVRAKGKYILLLNSDIVIIDDAVSRLVAFAQKHPDAGIVAPQLINADHSVQASIFRLPTIVRAVQQYWLGREGILDKYALSGTPQKVEAVVAAAFLITPAALSEVGKLSEKYFMYFEDLDYCREVRRAGLSIYYLSDVKIIHIHGASGKGKVNNLLVESSKKYFGNVQYYIYTFVLWSGQKLQKIF